MIITPSYFTGPIAIANGQDVAPNSELLGNGVKLQDFIDRYEREALISVLGYRTMSVLITTTIDSQIQLKLQQFLLIQ